MIWEDEMWRCWEQQKAFEAIYDYIKVNYIENKVL